MVVIIGGGLAGMSVAHHLGDVPHVVLESEADAGGLCRTRNVDGFLFDYTGHLLHLRDERITKLIHELLPDCLVRTARKAAIRTAGATLPFPFQANLHGLPPETIARCLTGFVESLGCEIPEDPAASFEQWSLAVFGQGISDAFMFPYNEKLFCRGRDKMTADWVSWAVPRPSLDQVIKGALGIENKGMGYNPSFLYPDQGGIGRLPQALAERLTTVRYGSRVEEVDLEKRCVYLADGEAIDYTHLVVTTPLPRFLNMIRSQDDTYDALAERLDWSAVECLNLGVDCAEIADGQHWIYYPDADVPFYRAGFPTNFSDGVAPAGTSSMYVEFGAPRLQPFDRVTAEREAIDALHREGILKDDDRILARDWVRIDPGYVIFDRSRQEVMQRVLPEMEQREVHLIGRYGAWTYSYMERALLDGLELAEKIHESSRQRV